jgi:hypothetical protein
VTKFQLLLQSDYEVDPNHVVLTVHPNHYNEVAEMIRAGLVLKGEPQAIDAEEWAEVGLLPTSEAGAPAETLEDMVRGLHGATSCACTSIDWCMVHGAILREARKLRGTGQEVTRVTVERLWRELS